MVDIQAVTDNQIIILASASPRRSEILSRLGIPFRAVPADIDEKIVHTDPHEAVKDLSLKKARASGSSFKGKPFRWHLGADTMVLAGNMMIGKPGTSEEAEKYLRLFSGKKHEVITALTLLDTENNTVTTSSESTSVWFAPLSGMEISWYLTTGEWEGAAGGYRIQEKGECLVERIEGSFSNVMGLPIRLFFSILLAAGYPVYNLPSGFAPDYR